MLFLIVDDVDQVKNSFSDDFLDSKEKNLIRNLISSFTLKEKKKSVWIVSIQVFGTRFIEYLDYLAEM